MKSWYNPNKLHVFSESSCHQMNYCIWCLDHEATIMQLCYV